MRTSTLSSEDQELPEPRRRRGGNALAVERTSLLFWASVAVAIPVIRWTNRGRWFFLDEWDFLADRSLGSLDDLLRPHNEHWTTIPIVVYRLLYTAIGLNHYWPYQAVAIFTHIGVAVLLRAIMRRSNVDPWIATTLAILFVFLGSGRTNIASGFQITFTGALLFGLAQMLLAAHEGPLGRRDVAAVACGIAALMCSGVGIAVVLGVGLSILLSRGWRIALVHMTPCALVLGLWVFTQHPGDQGAAGLPTVRGAAVFGARMLHSAVLGFAQSPLLAGLIAAAVIAGVVVAVARRGLGSVVRSQSPAIGLATAAVAFTGMTAVGRAQELLGTYRADRYVHVIVALLLPLVGFAATQLASTATWRRVAVVALLVLAVPGNALALKPTGPDWSSGNRDRWMQIAALAAEDRYPASARPPAGFDGNNITMGWLADGVASGRIPTAPVVSARLRSKVDMALSFAVDPSPSTGPCRRHAAGEVVRVREGQQIRASSKKLTIIHTVDGASLGSASFSSPSTVRLRAVRGPWSVKFRLPPGRSGPIEVCAQ